MLQNVLITGALGYVGGRLAQALQQAGHQVHAGTRSLSKTSVISNVATLVETDFESLASLDQACENIETVIHLAGMNEIDCAVNLEAAVKANTVYTLRLLEAARRQSVKNFLYFSTAHVYGSPLQGLLTEETLCRPIHPYAYTHKAAEDIVLAFHQKPFQSTVVVRLSNSFGPPVLAAVNRWTLLVNDLCKQLAETGRIQLKSDGKQLRDFITLTDVSRAVLHLLDQMEAQPISEIFNLGGNSSLSILTMAKLIGSRYEILTGKTPEIIVPPPTNSDIPPPLDLRSDKLARTGFVLSNRFEQEIDDELKFCLANFKVS
jgi:UDP-glucose 4-epimerase